MYCEDCGIKLNNGICSNCQEESYIVENQGEYITEPLSQDFSGKIVEQKSAIKRNRKKEKSMKKSMKLNQEPSE